MPERKWVVLLSLKVVVFRRGGALEQRQARGQLAGVRVVVGRCTLAHLSPDPPLSAKRK